MLILAPIQPKWVSLYDYEAADEEEVSLVEGDEVANVEEVDEGWVKVSKLRNHGFNVVLISCSTGHMRPHRQARNDPRQLHREAGMRRRGFIIHCPH